jgi:Alginate export
MRLRVRGLTILCRLLSGLILITSYSATVVAGDLSGLGDRLRFFRWLEDYDIVSDQELTTHPLAPLKRLAFSEAEYPYLTLGGDYRLRYEYYSNQFFGLRGDFSSDSVMHRVMLHGDLQFESARVFVQLADFEEQGQRGGPGPFDESDLDLQQAFVDWTPDWGRLRLGRQEISLGGGRKTGLREGPNQRRAFDGLRVTVNPAGRGPLDFIYSREVQANSEAFKDRSGNGPELFGVWASSLLSWSEVIHLDMFYLGVERERAVFNSATGDEKRHSIGARIWKRAGPVKFEYEATYQFGDFANGDISAWGLASETSFSFNQRSWQPRLGFRFNLASGDDDPNDNDLGTYNALFPNLAYVSEASIYAPGNGLDIQPFVELHPHRTLKLYAGMDFQWRLQRGDAVYASTGPLIKNDVSDARFNAYLISLVVTWTPSPYVTVQGAYVHNDAGDVVRDAGGKDVEFFMFSFATRF